MSSSLSRREVHVEPAALGEHAAAAAHLQEGLRRRDEAPARRVVVLPVRPRPARPRRVHGRLVARRAGRSVDRWFRLVFFVVDFRGASRRSAGSRSLGRWFRLVFFVVVCRGGVSSLGGQVGRSDARAVASACAPSVVRGARSSRRGYLRSPPSPRATAEAGGRGEQTLRFALRRAAPRDTALRGSAPSCRVM